MIKITNLNFQTQTIDNIEVDGEDVHNVELKLTKQHLRLFLSKKAKLSKSKSKRKMS